MDEWLGSIDLIPGLCAMKNALSSLLCVGLLMGIPIVTGEATTIARFEFDSLCMKEIPTVHSR